MIYAYRAQNNLGDAYRSSGQVPKAQAEYDAASELALKQVETNPREVTALGAI
jgi:hypothetical protein